MKLGEYIKKSRFDTRLKAREVAGRVGISDTELSRYENNRREPRIKVLVKLIDTLDMDFEQIKKIYATPEEENI